MTEVEWNSYRYQKEKLLAGEMCARLESGHGVFLLNREQMVFVLEAVKDHCELLMIILNELQDIDPPIYKDADFWSYVIDLLEVEIDELPDQVVYEDTDRVTYKQQLNRLFGGMHKPIVSYDRSSNYPPVKED